MSMISRRQTSSLSMITATIFGGLHIFILPLARRSMTPQETTSSRYDYCRLHSPFHLLDTSVQSELSIEMSSSIGSFQGKHLKSK